jgi:hypothetical protein
MNRFCSARVSTGRTVTPATPVSDRFPSCRRSRVSVHGLGSPETGETQGFSAKNAVRRRIFGGRPDVRQRRRDRRAVKVAGGVFPI